MVGQLRIVADEKPRVDRDAVAAHAGARLQDVDARVHVADFDDFVDVHVVVAADAGQLVGKGDVDGAERVFHDLCHFGRAYVGHDDVALAEGGVVLLYALAHLAAVGADGAVVVQELIDHVARYDALGGVYQVDVFPYLEAFGFDDGAHVFVHRAGAHGRFDHHRGALGAHAHDVAHGGHDVAGVDLL